MAVTVCLFACRFGLFVIVRLFVVVFGYSYFFFSISFSFFSQFFSWGFRKLEMGGSKGYVMGLPTNKFIVNLKRNKKIKPENRIAEEENTQIPIPPPFTPPQKNPCISRNQTRCVSTVSVSRSSVILLFVFQVRKIEGERRIPMQRITH